MKNLHHFICIISLALFLPACGSSGGGGGGGTTPPPPPANLAPTVDAGANQTVDEGTTVNLSGTASDTDGTIASYSWEGSGLTITNADMADASFVAPSTGSVLQTTLSVTLTVTDDDGATASDTVFITVNSTNQDPIADAGPDQTVIEQSTVTLDASGSTDDGTITSYSWSQLAGMAVTLSDTTAVMPTFTAPSISAQEVLEFDVLIMDDRGAAARDSVQITVNPDPALNNPPTVDAGPDITTSSGQIVNLSAVNFGDTDGTVEEFLWTQTSGIPVTINPADASDVMFQAPTVTSDEILTFELTVTDNEGATATDSVTVTVTPTPTTVNISGKATYDNVGHTASSGLNYGSVTQDPIRGAVVQLRQGTTTLQTSATDLAGNYSFDVDPNTTGLQVRILSRSVSTAAAKWDVKVVDNTNNQAFYSIVSSVFDAGTTDITRPDMNAGSGWGGSSYTGARAAAPFHILDRIADGVYKLVTVDPTIDMPAVDVNWSPNNNLTSGGLSVSALRAGNLGTSFYFTGTASLQEFEGPQLFILGAENSDTDEYDGHVVVHEWGHYFENNLSRSDSIGGSHTGSDRLDMRVAFGEGFGNAWSGIMTDDPFYRDSFGSQQASGFSISVENNSVTNRGWYNEASVQSILYDIYDTVNDGADGLNAGLQPIYDVLVGPQRTTDAFTSIFSFAEYYRAANPGDVTVFNNILNAQDISGTDRWGTGETNDAGANPSTNVLPVYTELTVGGTAQQVCSVDDYDSTGQTANSGNKLSNFRFVRFDIATTGNYTFEVSASANQDPDMPIYLQGQQVFFAAPGGDGDAGDATDSTTSLNADTYTAEAYEFDNTFRGNTANSSDECFTIRLVTN